ncbi:MAG: SpoIVB peptidase S55, partial [Phycisphaerae bacterium]|nr:SpoIVB peptidase S55 [Phycisphaerae bacterium]NIS51669.1 SpoIVB peptidase S55 [Phycisphaerae bacterium]NIU09260.1 SpoIVB peptidase S55 [Phycisphaerae bacterium]NIW93373.1 SpoIVB peptidase S55 [Phycisphaerae bacterium]NIW98944.1 SpoIVB peptidase S55 [Phycisphaerae bacterium]
MEIVGTATEVVGDKVYGFGHSYLGYGKINLPMATGQVHTVVSSIARSVKLASAIKTVGALTRDESTAIFGRIGAKPHMLP